MAPSPSDPGYAKAALTQAHIIAANNKGAGTDINASLTGGQMLGFYMVPAGTGAQALAAINAGNAASRPVFFSFTSANSDGINHIKTSGDAAGGWEVVGWEDQVGGGDQDYNDRIITVGPAATAVRGGRARRCWSRRFGHVPASGRGQVAVEPDRGRQRPR